MRFLVAALLACLLAAGPAVAREHVSDARHHLKKANELAGEGKCASAVKEYTAAYDKLRDPVVLFNRAECYRRLGENVKAAADYRGFLDGFPTAPNRADIEAKIAALATVAAPQRPSARVPPPPAPPPRASPPPAPARPPAPVAARPPAAPPPAAVAPSPPPPAVAQAPAAPPPTRASEPALGPMPFLPPPPGAGGDTNILVEAPKEPKKDPAPAEDSGSHWWLWTSLAVVAVGGGVAGYILLRPKDQPLPPTSLGNYRF